jgi:hypothetical protein
MMEATMNHLQEFAKIETEDEAIRFCKRVSSREIQSPLSKSQWVEIIEKQAEANVTDPALSKQQRFAKYLDTEVGRALFAAAKATPAGGAASAAARHVDFVKTAGTLDGDDYIAKRAELDGPASAKMHALAIDYQRTRGNSYAQAYSYVYGHSDNEGLRNAVKNEHLSRAMASVTG